MNDRQRGPDDVLPEVIELGVGQRFAREAELDDRDIGCAIAQYQRRRDVRRHVLEDHQGAARELRDRACNIGALIEINLLHSHALVTHRFDARDIVDQRG